MGHTDRGRDGRTMGVFKIGGVQLGISLYKSRTIFFSCLARFSLIFCGKSVTVLKAPVELQIHSTKNRECILSFTTSFFYMSLK